MAGGTAAEGVPPSSRFMRGIEVRDDVVEWRVQVGEGSGYRSLIR